LTLAENAGMDPIDTITELRARQGKGSKWTGIDVKSAKVTDVSKLDIVEPVSVKEQIVKSATEVASMILRIDDVIASSKSAGGPPGGGMPPGGMGGMGGGGMDYSEEDSSILPSIFIWFGARKGLTLNKPFVSFVFLNKIKNP
jgi:hypothetical protein